MMKAGIYEEMLEDTMDVLETEEEEEDAQAEIDKILNELTAGALGAAPDALKGEDGFNISNLHIHRLFCHPFFRTFESFLYSYYFGLQIGAKISLPIDIWN